MRKLDTCDREDRVVDVCILFVRKHRKIQGGGGGGGGFGVNVLLAQFRVYEAGYFGNR